MRVGLGFDVHRFQEGRPLILGGVQIPHSRGLAGHSDADVLIHALMDAILGAMGAGDIGRHFPDNDKSLAGVDSTELLKQVMALARGQDYQVINVDAVVVAEEPRLAPYRAGMESKLAAIMGVKERVISIKATTTEGLGFTGRREGIAAQVVVLLAIAELIREE